MEGNFSNLGRYITILDRLMKMYYDRELSKFKIGWGQQFYVEYLYEHPGASAQDMVERFRVDKGTLTKVIKKLTEIGYVKVVRNQADKRIKQLYLTEEALPSAEKIKEIHISFYDTLCGNIAKEDISRAERIMEQMMENVTQKVWHRMEEHHGEQ
ncbi:MAG: MarR family winged helix-turn-helix transcriptional regulator [Ruminococcus sp.]|jgi:DNA-binding MarR family transcriptional regulator